MSDKQLFTSDQLLKNTAYVSNQPFGINHYYALLMLARGLVSSDISQSSIVQLEKLGFHVDLLIDYITNIFEYEMFVKDNDISEIYVTTHDRQKLIGTLDISINSEGRLDIQAHSEVSLPSSSLSPPLQASALPMTV
ncbi:ac26-like protein [Clanis bilineata nucleopolyhedrovirus]|uniref:Ac26-like protein n=1 Tax=Clanis bilineata nucleopolyhedrovirus TaxID=1307957 RepID=Q0N483_9ABAC|nr:ac26-like protein [Clanis bilineata nucleopolyhedrovirus]ABF47360.1 ac26-like protein [Clanis bilineata nucleopolyhedrovirus]